MSDVDCHDREADEPEGMLQKCHDEAGKKVRRQEESFASLVSLVFVNTRWLAGIELNGPKVHSQIRKTLIVETTSKQALDLDKQG